jgi:hypothetical protein
MPILLTATSISSGYLQGPEAVFDRVRPELDAVKVVDDPFQLEKQDGVQALDLVCMAAHPISLNAALYFTRPDGTFPMAAIQARLHTHELADELEDLRDCVPLLRRQGCGWTERRLTGQ